MAVQSQLLKEEKKLKAFRHYLHLRRVMLKGSGGAVHGKLEDNCAVF